MLLNMDNNIDDPKETDIIQEHPSVQNLVDPIERDLKLLIGHEFKSITTRKMANNHYKIAHQNIKNESDNKELLF
jgi:hypothetical protein